MTIEDLLSGKCTINEYNSYLIGKKSLESEVLKLKIILNELSEIKNLQKWYNFDSISLTQMQLRQWIRGQLDE
jgi:hypothetical protein